jgi:thioredoxin-like negative regulator of GroEL
MSGLLFLTSDDFNLIKSEKGNIMKLNNIPGFSLILFYSTKCDHCTHIIPIFKKLPSILGGCNFGMININNNKECIMMSRQSITNINVVPYIILYIDEKPYMRYEGSYTEKEISNFIIKISTEIKNNQEKDSEGSKYSITDQNENIVIDEEGEDLPVFVSKNQYKKFKKRKCYVSM